MPPPPIGPSLRRQLQWQRSPGCHIPGEDFTRILSEIVKCASCENQAARSFQSLELVCHQTGLVGCVPEVAPLETTQVFRAFARLMSSEQLLHLPNRAVPQR